MSALPGKPMNRLTGRQHYQLMKWIEANKELVLMKDDAELVPLAIAEVKFDLNRNHMIGARRTLGLKKAHAGGGQTKPRPTFTELDEEAFVKINCLARCVNEIYEQFGIESAARNRLKELFSLNQLKYGGNAMGGATALNQEISS